MFYKCMSRRQYSASATWPVCHFGNQCVSCLALVIFRDDVLCNQMLEISWIDNPRYDDPEVDRRLATEKLLCDLRDRFAEHGKTNTDYGLPVLK